MEDLFKKMIADGVGWISETSEKFKNTIDSFIEEGKIKAEEGKKIVDEYIKETSEKKEELEGRFKEVIEKTIESLKFARLEELMKLEKRVAKLETNQKKPATAIKPKTGKAGAAKTKKTTVKKKIEK